MNTTEFTENVSSFDSLSNRSGTKPSKYFFSLPSRIREDRQAVSPVVAVFLMIGITVVLAAVLYSWAGTCDHRDMHTPIVLANCSRDANDDYIITITDVDTNIVTIQTVNYILLDEHSRAVPGEQGGVKDIANQKSKQLELNITFRDNDMDGNLSAGDTFKIIHISNGGIAFNGYALLLKFVITGDKMNGGGT